MSNKSMTPAAVKAIRADLRMTQARLADAIGVSRATVARWEMDRDSPHSRVPDRQSQKALAMLLYFETHEPPRG